MDEITIENLWYSYPTSKEPVLKKVNLKVSKGEFLTIMGPTGAGKTTLCLTLNGLIPHSFGGEMKGNVIIAGKNAKESVVSELSQKVGIVLQNPESNLFCMTVEEELAFGPENMGLPPDEIQRRIDWATEVVRLEGLQERSPFSLSGGQKQRVAIAAALSMLPTILVLDEPTANLDPIGKLEVFSTIRDLKERLDITVIVVEHESEAIAEFSDRIAVMNQGKITVEGTPDHVFSRVEELESLKLRVPQVKRLEYMLNRQLHTDFSFPSLDLAQKKLSELPGERRRST